MPHDPHLAVRMRAALAGRPGIAERRMFGGCCWLPDGNTLCGVEVGRFVFRVGKQLEAELDGWIDFAARFVGSLPPK